MTIRIASSRAAGSRDIARIRNSARIIAGALAFSVQDQTRIATAVSEITRNGIQYATVATVRFEIDTEDDSPVLRITVKDDGKGIERIDLILAGGYSSNTGMGMGLLGAKRLMDVFVVDTGPGGTTVVMGKFLPKRDAGQSLEDRAIRAAEALQTGRNADPVAELEHQNSELLHSLQEIKTREDMLERTNRKLTAVTDELTRSLERSRFLLQELHHRVKNNLQIIGSLVSMHRRKAREPETETALASLADRVRAFGVIHDQLYRHDGDSTIELETYLSAICSNLQDAMNAPDRDIRIETAVVSQPVALEFAQDIGLLVNELVMNACKHAFPSETAGRVFVELRRVGDKLLLTVSDNGVGLTGAVDPARASIESLGLMVVQSTVRKLGGGLSIDGTDGFVAEISVPVPETPAPGPFRLENAPA